MSKTSEKPDVLQVEKTGSLEHSLDDRGALKLDKHGLPLRPQPSDDPLDPLNWSPWLKAFVLLQVSVLAFLGPFTQAVINPAYVPSAKALHISVQSASYQTTVPILFAGLAPLIWSPLSNIYGRRPIFVFVTALGIATLAAAGAAPRFSGILVARAFVGIGTSAGMGIGAAAVADMYFMHERGRFSGIFVIFVTNGAHIAAVVGGFIALRYGWRWTSWVPCIVLACNWLVNLFCLPETLYHRTNQAENKHTGSWTRLMTFQSLKSHRKLHFHDFTRVVRMLAYPSVLLPVMYYSVSFGFASVLFAVTASSAFNEIYHFNTAQTGLCLGFGTFSGTLVGELTAGPVSDRILYLKAKKNDGVPIPEVRLQAMWPALLLIPAGIIIEGVCFQYKTHFMGPVMGMAIGNFGLQVASTNIYAYMTDCYKPQSAEMSTLLNFGRQVFSFPIGFYALPFAKATTFGVAWAVLAIIDVVLYMGIILLMWKGRAWREKLGSPPEGREDDAPR